MGHRKSWITTRSINHSPMKTVSFSLARSVSIAPLIILVLALVMPTAGSSATFADPNLEAAVRSTLGKPTGDLTLTDMLALRALGAPQRQITSLVGLELALNLEYLDLENNAISDLTPLAGLSALQNLFLDNNQLTSGAPLAGLTNLMALTLNYNSIHDVSWLAGLSHLQSLGLMFNPLDSAAAVAGLTSLTDLRLNGTGTSEVSFLRGLSNLTQLGLGDNGISDSSPLAGLTKLEFLGFGGNPGANLEVLSGLTNLKTLYLFSDGISDVSFLGGLRNLTWLRLADNQISDVSPLAGLTKLQYLDLSYNSLANGAPLAGLTALQGLELEHNRIPSLNFAQNMSALTNLDVSNNQVTNINALLNLMNLSSVTLNGNLLDLAVGSPSANVIQALQNRGVTVDTTAQSMPYVPTKGTYSGLFYAGDAFTHSNSGSITLTTTVQRKYTGKLQLGGGSYGFNGTFKPDGTVSTTVKRGKQPMLLLNLAMQGTDYATGTVSASGETWTADLLANRVMFDGRTSRSLQAGRYTLALEGSNSPALPAGNGYGTLTVNPAGRLSLVGSLADGTRFSQSAWVSAYGQWPLYIRLYSGKGSVLSWMSFTDGQTLGGDLAWSKPAGKTKRYPAGFAWITQAAGARYNAPGRGTNAFGMTGSSLTLTLAGGDLKASLASQFTLNAKNQVKALPASNTLRLSFNPAKGLFSGRMADPATHTGVAFGGVILQNQTNGFGYFLGTSTSGQVLLGQ
jgi:Leucine-rich repeat (LRR) protein